MSQWLGTVEPESPGDQIPGLRDEALAEAGSPPVAQVARLPERGTSVLDERFTERLFLLSPREPVSATRVLAGIDRPEIKSSGYETKRLLKRAYRR